MFDFVDFVLDVDELEVGFVFVAGFVVVVVVVVVVGLLSLGFLDNGIHFLSLRR
jgi:hypothetical protein